MEGSAGVLLTEALLQQLQTKAPVNTGEYRAKLQARMRAYSGGTVIEGIGPDPLSTWITQGTKPHEIVPVNATALHFFWHGTEVFTRHVNHPGTQPNPFHLEAATAAVADVRAAMGPAVAGVVRDAIKKSA